MPATFDRSLDCSGMPCPMPILKTRKAVDAMAVGQTLRMTATDPGAPADIAAWTQKTGHALVGSEQAGEAYVFYIRKTH
ncbi:MAG TPA: sulfurtransferase TusA family protein [Usitatibacter sp.]|nr:sulfurtransferase TusA family protein [Usitatibacter sp.]